MFTSKEQMIKNSIEYDKTKSCTYRQRLALKLGGKQWQRSPKWWI